MATKKRNQGSKWIRPEKRERIYKRDNHTCVYCGGSIYMDSEMLLTLDHVVAYALGGTNDANNLVTACRSCNSSKRHLSVPQFIQYLSDQGTDTSCIAKNVRNARRRKLGR